MMTEQYCYIDGEKDGQRISSRVLEERIQEALKQGKRHLVVNALGQHGIGGRLWNNANHTPEGINIEIEGHSGQRVGAMGYPHTFIQVLGPASDDVGWLNAGAEIVVYGHAGNGVANAMAQGKIFVGGNIGARGMTMTKHNPRFEAPELWVLGGAGDFFGEFMAGGIAVICGYEAQNPENVLGYRPLVGMVGGQVFVRGPHQGFSQVDAQQIPITDEKWAWLEENLSNYLHKIGRSELFNELSDPQDWQLICSRSPQERKTAPKRSMQAFKQEVWDKNLGPGGIVGDLSTSLGLPRETLPLITRGEMRRFVPVWEQGRYLAPCEASCPTGIPVQERWRLIREGRVDEAVDLALSYTPFPATVCGYLCPNLCMQSCTRKSQSMTPVNIQELGKASLQASLPELPELSGHKIAILGGGPAGISSAWQLRLRGHEAVIYDNAPNLGGKIASVIPKTRIPEEVFQTEIQRMEKVIPHVHLQQELAKDDLEQLAADYDYLIIATGAQKPRSLPIPGREKAVSALDFLAKTKTEEPGVGQKVVIIGAGNVGCDAATEAHRLGAKQISLLDIQKPAASDKEFQEAQNIGAIFKWPVSTTEITEQGVQLESGEFIEADTVILALGETPDLHFLPSGVQVEKGFIQVDNNYQTSREDIFAIGDVVRPGLLTEAIGAGLKAAQTISNFLEKKRPVQQGGMEIDPQRVSLEYFDPRITDFHDLEQCGSQCASCGHCRDCGICVAVCPEAAISRRQKSDTEYEYVVDPQRCIGCGFCAGACPCGVWNLVENEPLI